MPKGRLGSFARRFLAAGSSTALGYSQPAPRDTLKVMRLAAGRRHFVVLRPDGTVVAVGNNSRGQCNVEGWREVVAAGATCTLGLRGDGVGVEKRGK